MFSCVPFLARLFSGSKAKVVDSPPPSPPPIPLPPLPPLPSPAAAVVPALSAVSPPSSPPRPPTAPPSVSLAKPLSPRNRSQPEPGSATSPTSPANPVRRGQQAAFDLSRDELRKIALHTLDTFREGSYMPPGSDEPYDLEEKIRFTTQNTIYFPPEDPRMTNWREKPNPPESEKQEQKTVITIGLFASSVALRRFYKAIAKSDYTNKRVGILNYASGVKAAGGFVNGAQAQEESLCRVSTLRESLVLAKCKPFYQYWTRDRNPYYSNSVMYAPNVVFFKNDRGFFRAPMVVDVVTGAAVNAKEVREAVRARRNEDSDSDSDDDDDDDEDESGANATDTAADDPLEAAEKKIKEEMFERMGRILRAFEMHGIRHIVLGGFGTGVCQNPVEQVAQHWKALLVGDDARFKDSFDTVLMPAFDAQLAAIWDSVFGEVADRFPEEVQSDDEGTPPHRASDGGADNDIL